jgi:hypothetical protein
MMIDVARTRANEEGRAQIAAWLEECRRGESDRLAEALDVAQKTTLRPIEVMEMFASARQIAKQAKAAPEVEEFINEAGVKWLHAKATGYWWLVKKDGSLKRWLGEPEGLKKILTEPQPAVEDQTQDTKYYETVPEAEPSERVRQEAEKTVSRALVLKSRLGHDEEEIPEPEDEPGRAVVLRGPSALDAFDFSPNSNLGELLALMNTYHSIIENVGGKTAIACWVVPEEDPYAPLRLVYHTIDSFKLQHSHRRVPTEVPDGEAALQVRFDDLSRVHHGPNTKDR